MAAKSLDAARLRKVRQQLPVIEAQLRGLASHCSVMNESAASWKLVPRALLDLQVSIHKDAIALLDRLARLEAEAGALRARGGAPPKRLVPGQRVRFQTTADLPASIKRAKRAAGEFDRNFKQFGAKVDLMMNDPTRYSDPAEPLTLLAKVIDGVTTIAEIVAGIVELSKRKK